MREEYLGKVDPEDPLYPTLLSATGFPRGAVFHARRTGSPRAYCYAEERSGLSVVGKFRGNRAAGRDGTTPEYDNLLRVRGKGLDCHPCFAVRPLAVNDAIGLLLLSEYVAGVDLDHFLRESGVNGHTSPLHHALGRLARFLATLHAKTEEDGDPFASIEGYGAKLTRSLRAATIFSSREETQCLELLGVWRSSPVMQLQTAVLVHGDPTPTNFIFTREGGIAAIDLEMMKTADPVFDLGIVCGEIKHAFLWRRSDRNMSEPFIDAFLRSYIEEAQDPGSAFRDITMRLPYFMALAEMRIARNDYLSADYRRSLAREAIACLSHGIVRLC